MSDWAHKGINIPEIAVYGARPMKEIGVQQTKFDTVILKENIALSMADVLTFNSSIFVKNYGRATLSTVAFRGTSPSHTQVSWNGMKINNLFDEEYLSVLSRPMPGINFEIFVGITPKWNKKR